MNDLRDLIKAVEAGVHSLLTGCSTTQSTDELFHDTVTALQKQLKFWMMSDWKHLDAVAECLAHMLFDFNSKGDDSDSIEGVLGALEVLEVKLRGSCQDYKEWGDLMQERS